MSSAGGEAELLRKALLQRGSCRLCLAPDTECVPIFSTTAADKEPLSSKILACVAIKVSRSRIPRQWKIPQLDFLHTRVHLTTTYIPHSAFAFPITGGNRTRNLWRVFASIECTAALWDEVIPCVCV